MVLLVTPALVERFRASPDDDDDEAFVVVPDEVIGGCILENHSSTILGMFGGRLSGGLGGAEELTLAKSVGLIVLLN